MKETTRRALQAIADNRYAHASVREWARNMLAGKAAPLDPNIVYPGSPAAPDVSPDVEEDP